MFISLFLPPTAAASLMVITHFTYAGNAKCGNLIHILLSY
jgi:hypothetical protein